MPKYYPVGDTAFRYKKVEAGMWRVVIVASLHPFDENVAGLTENRGDYYPQGWQYTCYKCARRESHYYKRQSAAKALCMHYIKEHLDERSLEE